MDGLILADNAKEIVAPLNFTEPMAEFVPLLLQLLISEVQASDHCDYCKPGGFRLLGGCACNTKPEAHEIRIIDARPFAGRLSLDREGFVLLNRPTAVKNLYDEDEIVRAYYPECERLIAAVTGAMRVHAFGHTVRNAALSAKGNQIKLPASQAHCDYTAWSAPRLVRRLMGAEAEELLKHGFAVIHVWRPIRGPLLRSPLALCNAQSLAEENLDPDRFGETYAVTYNPEQRWYYFPKMLADECILMRCFDSARQGAARFFAHSAFDDPETPDDAPPRESIEVRAFVSFKD